MRESRKRPFQEFSKNDQSFKDTESCHRSDFIIFTRHVSELCACFIAADLTALQTTNMEKKPEDRTRQRIHEKAFNLTSVLTNLMEAAVKDQQKNGEKKEAIESNQRCHSWEFPSCSFDPPMMAQGTRVEAILQLWQVWGLLLAPFRQVEKSANVALTWSSWRKKKNARMPKL